MRGLSPSSIGLFNICPRQWEAKYIRGVYFPFTQQQSAGIDFHKVMQDSINTWQPPQDEVALRAYHFIERNHKDDQVFTELMIMLNDADEVIFQKNNWDFSCRTPWNECNNINSTADLVAISDDKAFVYDWKTGKYKADDIQPDLVSKCLFSAFPQLQEVEVTLLYVNKDFQKHNVVRTRDEPISSDTALIISNLRLSESMGSFPPKKSGLCSYCPVTDCEKHPKFGTPIVFSKDVKK